MIEEAILFAMPLLWLFFALFAVVYPVLEVARGGPFCRTVFFVWGISILVFFLDAVLHHALIALGTGRGDGDSAVALFAILVGGWLLGVQTAGVGWIAGRVGEHFAPNWYGKIRITSKGNA